MSTLSELQAQKANIEAAIDKILVAQEYQEGATKVKKADLQTLYDRLDNINSRIARITGGCISLSPVFGDSK